MTTTNELENFGHYLQFLRLDKQSGKLEVHAADGGVYSASVGNIFKISVIENKVYEVCEKEKLDYQSESTVKKYVKEAIQDAYAREKTIENGNGKASKEIFQKIVLTDELTREVGLDEVGHVLSTSIKKDDTAKQITFLAMLLAQSYASQINVGFQAESSAGKSYVPIELATYFPQSEVHLIASASPTAFFHDRGQFDKETGILTVDLEGKILVFLDMPGYQILERLRPLLSHDKKELFYKITDRSVKAGLRTKNVRVLGYPSVIFCSAKLQSDEQERTRLILLSPSVDKEKLEESIRLADLRNCDSEAYKESVDGDPKRKWLTDRILAIRQSGVREVKIPGHEVLVRDRFLSEHEDLKARHQRDFPRIISLIKAHAILNLFHRTRTGDMIEATKEDIEAGFRLYSEIQESNDLGLSPYVYTTFEKVIRPRYSEDVGLETKQIQKYHYLEFHRTLSSSSLSEILSQLEAASLIDLQKDERDKRRLLVFKPSS